LIDCPQTPQVVHNAYACSQKNWDINILIFIPSCI
jgi:hypothetical protein